MSTGKTGLHVIKIMCINLLEFAVIKQSLDSVFVISGIIKVEVSISSRNQRLKLITLTEALIIPGITKTESNDCYYTLF